VIIPATGVGAEIPVIFWPCKLTSGRRLGRQYCVSFSIFCVSADLGCDVRKQHEEGGSCVSATSVAMMGVNVVIAMAITAATVGHKGFPSAFFHRQG
jgi:hypothetical protein